MTTGKEPLGPTEDSARNSREDDVKLNAAGREV